MANAQPTQHTKLLQDTMINHLIPLTRNQLLGLMGQTYGRDSTSNFNTISGVSERKFLTPIYNKLVQEGHITERPNPNSTCIDPDPYVEINLRLKFE